ncbi:hypothetical protein [Tsukamurella pulmonis]|uniref:hypothetical protein n=1 Tax=Tsukamurella pulmonis TaxID=47312 RepID=UPI000E09967C|nr:hypothetical protein [Tsukamurella pulmonis]RDH13411.1 hypothetical protein DVB88_02530 [Tsukamurella pulmonis]
MTDPVSRSPQRTFFVAAPASSVAAVERVLDAGLDEDRIWIAEVEFGDEMIAVDFFTYGLDLDAVEAVLREKLRRVGFRTVGYIERFG